MKPVYFHCQPGAHGEITLAGLQQTDLIAQDRAEPDTHVIGFSLGAHAALRFVAEQGARRVDLIAPAAPLQLGNFLGQMAGAPVFRAAHKGRLSALTWGQAALARTAPGLLIRMILSGATPADLALFAKAPARQTLTQLLRHSLIENRDAYQSAIIDCVQDWTPLIGHITCPVSIWQGTADTWVPQQMATALAARLPNATLEMLPEAGHYSALVRTLPRLTRT